MEFILGGRAAECLKEFIEKHAYSCDPKLFLLKKYASNNLEIVTSRLFGITSIDLSGNKNVFHYAAQVLFLFFSFLFFYFLKISKINK